MPSPRQAAPFRLLFGALALVAVSRQLAVTIAYAQSLVSFISFFTNLANLLAAATFVWGGVRALNGRSESPGFDRLRLVNTANMTVVGIVFHVLLRNTDLGLLIAWVNVVVHYVMPAAVVLDWVIAPPRRKLGAADWWWCWPMPLAYLLYSMARGALTGWYPYPFLRPEVTGGYAGVAVYVAAIMVLFVGVGALAVWTANRRVAAR
ncbi:MAG: Pr6Pr family membrane protein [Vicinamibacterales bacterium]